MARTYSDIVSLVRKASQTRKLWQAEQLAINAVGVYSDDLERARMVIKDMIVDGGLIEVNGCISFNTPVKD